MAVRFSTIKTILTVFLVEPDPQRVGQKKKFHFMTDESPRLASDRIELARANASVSDTMLNASRYGVMVDDIEEASLLWLAATPTQPAQTRPVHPLSAFLSNTV